MAIAGRSVACFGQTSRTYLIIARACDGNDFRFRLGASEAVWPVQTWSEQQRRRRKLRPGLGLSKSGAGRGAEAAHMTMGRGLCVRSRTSASRTELQPPSRRVTVRTGARSRGPLGMRPRKCAKERAFTVRRFSLWGRIHWLTNGTCSSLRDRTRLRCVVRLVNTTGIDCASCLAAIVF